jgi:hypothetical protein
MKEAEFTRQVIQLAQLYGWRVAHFRPARTLHGWCTPVAGDGAGFPDLLLLRETLLAVELKVGRNKPSAKQVEWLESLKRAGIFARVWTPADWNEIQQTLTRKVASDE